MNRVLIVLSLLFLSSCFATRNTLQRDPIALNQINDGKVQLKNKRYSQAALLFESARKRPFNQHTTVATYYAGLAYYYDGKQEQALERFNTIITDYNKSKYVKDATYHKALLLIDSGEEGRMHQGFELLTNQLSRSTDSEFIRDARNSLKRRLYESTPLDFLENYLPEAPAFIKSEMIEAMCLRKIQAGAYDSALQLFQQAEAEGITLSEQVNAYFNNAPEVEEGDGIFRVALFLPLNLQNRSIEYTTEIPSRSRAALDFYEGFVEGIKTFTKGKEKKIFVRVIDTRSDTFEVKFQLREVERLAPDLVIGALRPNETGMLSDWAEENQIPLIVPRLPFPELLEDKSYTFLAHPSVYTQGGKMAEYAFKYLQLNSVLIWTDQTLRTQQLAEGFSRTFDLLGGNTQLVTVDSIYEIASERIPDLVRGYAEESRTEDQRDARFDSWYIPLTNNEESAGLILAELNRGTTELSIMGSPQWWTRYHSIDPELKDSFGLLFSSSNFIESESDAYKAFYAQYLREYRMPPNDLNVQGYDLAGYLAFAVEKYNPQLNDFASHLHKLPQYSGLHLDVYFGAYQDNQYANIAEFRDGEAVKMNAGWEVGSYTPMEKEEGEDPAFNWNKKEDKKN